MRFGVQGPGFRVQGAGCRVQGAGFRVQGAGFRVQDAIAAVTGIDAEGRVVSSAAPPQVRPAVPRQHFDGALVTKGTFSRKCDACAGLVLESQ